MEVDSYPNLQKAQNEGENEEDLYFKLKELEN
jgi:hypothetical protein